MFSEEKIRKVNKVIKDMVFDCEGEIHTGMYVNIEYQFQITGTKKMISVGEWYDFLVVDITIVDGDKRFDILSKLMPDLITKEYRLLVNLDMSISDELTYFFNGNNPKIHIPSGGVKLSDDYQNKINNMDLTNPNL